jgi:hypothetical protein
MGAILLAAARAYAGTPDTGNRHFMDSADHVKIAGVDPVGDGGEVIVTVVIDPGFHINANPASLGYLIPTTLNVTSETPLRVIYPGPLSFKPKFAERPIDVYQGRIQIIAYFPASSGRSPHLFGTLTVQACTDVICLPPADLPLPGRR